MIRKWLILLMFLSLFVPIAHAIPISPIIPSGTTLPTTCRTGVLFIDLDQDTDGALYQCVATDDWKLVGGSASDTDLVSLAAGITGLVKGLGDGNGYEAATSADYLSPTLQSNIVLNDKYLTETETSLTDSDAASPNLSGGGTYFQFTDDGGTDVDSITGFTNFPTDVSVEFRFEDAYWTVDFSQANLYGHGELLWSPRAGDTMICRSHDGTKIECNVSMPTALAISQVYHLPMDSTPDSDDSWAGKTTEFLAGETLAQWDTVFIDNDAGTPELKEWDCNLPDDCSAADTPYDCCTGADAGCETIKPFGVVIESGGIADAATGTITIGVGIGRNDGWTFIADSEDEGKSIYGLADGLFSDVAPSTTGEYVCEIGTIFNDDIILFDFGRCALVEVP